MSTRVEVIIDTDGEDIPVRDLFEFLELFRAAYVMGIALGPGEGTMEMLGEASGRLAYAIRQNVFDEERALGYMDLSPDEELRFGKIRRENPIGIVLAGIGIALTAAVILSGGQISIDEKSVHAKLPPLGHGIKKLREALRREEAPRPRKKPSQGNDPSPGL